MLTNKEFVRDQFNIFNRHAAFRDVLMLTSFIETIIRDTAKPRKEFKKSLESLGLIIKPGNEKLATYSDSCAHIDSCLIEANMLRVLRNELLHDIIRKGLPQNYIHSIIEEMRNNIIVVYDNSKLVREYFIDEYKFDTKGILLHRWLKK